MPFVDRADAGRRLAVRLHELHGREALVLALPRGGVPVGYEVARALGAPLDVIVVRKLGAPFQPELAMGAIGEGGVRVLDEGSMRAADVLPDELEAIEQRERDELDRRALRYRGRRPRLSLQGRVAIIVDDGIATGSTARAACRVARAMGASRIVLAAPVAPRSTARELARDADEVVLLATPEDFVAVGRFYDDFMPTSDEEVESLLCRAAEAVAAPGASPGEPSD